MRILFVAADLARPSALVGLLSPPAAGAGAAVVAAGDGGERGDVDRSVVVGAAGATEVGDDVKRTIVVDRLISVLHLCVLSWSLHLEQRGNQRNIAGWSPLLWPYL